MTPEEVMSHKDRLIQSMIKVCKSDLEGIGLEITTMNIADVEDHRLDGVKEPDLYIALLKRIQTANAESQSREAKAMARASAKEQEEERRAEVAIRALDNERQNIDARTKVLIAQERQRGALGMQEATKNAESEVAGVHAQIEAEKQRIEMVGRNSRPTRWCRPRQPSTRRSKTRGPKPPGSGPGPGRAGAASAHDHDRARRRRPGHDRVHH